MISRRTSGLLAGGLLAASAALSPAAAQGAPAPLPPASPPPPASQVTPPPPTPPANAVALCNDGSYLVAPALPSGCATRGGLKLTLPGFKPSPAADAAAAQAESRAEATSAPRSDTPPVGATMRCKDGTWLFGAPAAARCAGNGGLAAILPPPAPPAPPVRPPTP